MDQKRHLISYVLGQPISATYLNPKLNSNQQIRYDDLCQRLDSGEPLAYLLGSAEFWSLTLKVTPDVLIPRPETELLVEQALSRFPEKSTIHVLELGTGSGTISIALKKERPHWKITATDKSSAALAIAKHNAETHQTDIEFVESDWFQSVERQEFDLILSNPPYIAEDDPHLLGEIRYEPQMALQSGNDGLRDLRFIIQHAQEHLITDGILLLEHGYDQGLAVQQLLKKQGYQTVQTLKDIFGNDRVSSATKG